MNESPAYGECPKHRGNSMFDCPVCAMENFRFEIPKDIILPPCDSANGKQVEIDTLPKPKTKYVWVTYDPLLEKIICVHESGNSFCDVCLKIWNQRRKENSLYQIYSVKRKLKP